MSWFAAITAGERTAQEILDIKILERGHYWMMCSKHDCGRLCSPHRRMEDCGQVQRQHSGLVLLLGHPVSRQRGWGYLKSLRLRLRVPRPEHDEADPIEPEAWKKNSSRRRPDSKRSTLTPMSKFGQRMKECFGLKPVVRRVWVDEWTTPTAEVPGGYDWLWLYGFVQPETGKTKGLDSAQCPH